MADSRLDALEKVPPWQLVLGWALGATLIGLGFYFLYFSETLAAKTQAEAAVTKAETDLKAAQDKLANYEERVKEQAEKDAELKKMLERVAVDSSTVDHLMSSFQRDARAVGLALERWVPQPEERYDNYAKIPVEVTAVGTWNQFGEFFRRVSEMTKIVNVEGVEMKIGRDYAENGFPLIEVDFVASTFRLITDGGGPDEEASSRRSKRKG